MKKLYLILTILLSLLILSGCEKEKSITLSYEKLTDKENAIIMEKY